MTDSDWAELWGDVPEPVWRAVLQPMTEGDRVLDVGCGAGHFLAYARSAGLRTSGADVVPELVELARQRAQEAVVAEAEHLPWPDATFELVTAFNALQFADDTDAALAEMVRVTKPGGYVAVANWAEAARNDLDAIERALNDGESAPDGDLRHEGGLAELLTGAGLSEVAESLVAVPWRVPHEEALVRGILLGEQPDLAPEVVAAARPYRKGDGSYELVNHFRLATGLTAPGS
ncbi:class I SAM-dependent methyltransferase [Symbioplanes lichenis]|uniref:class I SAM-dependent methyltransferase n=1 Tax=Symbioplanes lichenis TaxID=1629072 RepID=UPI00273A1A62|nr:class I SAM-dependent methyltransferase [Actinoplanes lichenis]